MSRMSAFAALCAFLLLLELVAAPGANAGARGVAPADPVGVMPHRLTEADLSAFADYVSGMLEDTGVPGAAVAVVQDGAVIYEQGFGVRALGGEEPVTPDTLMMVGSVTKPVTATMAATLVDDGLVEWETPLAGLLPDFAVADPDLSRRLTLQDAFCACTGVPQRDPEFIFTSGDMTPERLIASVAAFPLTARPGEQFQYSNQMFAIGGYAAAAAAVAGDGDLLAGYEAAVEQRLLAPLGMARSTFALQEVVADGDYAMPHGMDLVGAYRPASLADDERHVRSVAPAGALWSSAAEMARFVEMELAGGLAPDGARIVSAANLAATLEQRVAIPGPPAEAAAPSDFAAMARGYGLGWVVGDYRGRPLRWHSGGTFGYSTQVAFLPESGLGVVVLTNGINAQLFTLAVQFRLFELAFRQPASFDAVVAAALDDAERQTAAMREQLVPYDPAVAAPLLGCYASDALGEVAIAPGDEALILDAGDFRAELLPVRGNEPGTTWLTSDLPLPGPATVTFGRTGNGPTMTFTDPTTGEDYQFAFVGPPSTGANPEARRRVQPASGNAVGGEPTVANAGPVPAAQAPTASR